MSSSMVHQYIDRETSLVRTEHLFGDGLIRFFYDETRERTPALFRALTSARMSRLLAYLHYDRRLAELLPVGRRFLSQVGVDLAECLGHPDELDTPQKVFERRIRFWDCRPMSTDPGAVVSPADSRVLLGSLAETSLLFLKEKFFDLAELVDRSRPVWVSAFAGGDWAIFRLTPDKYHYSHTPVAGVVRDFYTVDGLYHSCNPCAVVAMATPYSKNKRTVTIIDTDVEGGTGVGLVAMIEVVALMIGEVVQCYSPHRYDLPRPARPGMFLRKGQPKSRYRPGSSTDVLLFQPGRVAFAEDLTRNLHRQDVASRFSAGFSRSLVETDVKVRSDIGRARRPPCTPRETRS
ncbi:MAG: phosphatidylserine decarboxylase [Thermodesulfobacteriota bacterium]